MARCSVCSRFARFMEMDEPAAPHGPAHVHPDVAGVHFPSCRHGDDDEPAFRERRGDGVATAAYSPFQGPDGLPAARPVSISLPASPSAFDVTEMELQLHPMLDPSAMCPAGNKKLAQPQPADKVMFRSQPFHAAPPRAKSSEVRRDSCPMDARPPRVERATRARRDTSFDPFKTFSGKLEKQITTHLLGGRPHQQQEEEDEEEAEQDDDAAASRSRHITHMPKVQRFFAALEGPELDTLRSSEKLVLPTDKTWPFLLRFPVSAFGMCMGMSSQAILWKRIAISASTRFLHITLKINLALWCVSVALMAVVSAVYACKIAFYFEAVRREYYHPVRVNFFFAPWIACLFLAIGVPEQVAPALPQWLWYVLMAPILCLELKIYGQWISGGQRRLSRVANPSNHLSIVGNFVGALLGGIMGLKEGPTFFFAVGLAHYIVLFVTLYQRLPTSETLPRDLHPVFFLFVATPSVACLAWARITGEFGFGSRIAYFVAMFLYASLAVRINLFRGFRFSLAWWAYTFPMTSAAIASIRYSSEVAKNAFTQSMCIGLSAAATLTVAALFLTTLLHAVVHRDLFPNDISIAITERRLQPSDSQLRDRDRKRGKQGPAPSSGYAAGADAGRDLEAAVATSYT
ncbi:hypothetical protein ACP4OV_013331 [Aristida adscensionis]